MLGDLKRARGLLERKDVDLTIATSFQNVYYFSQYPCPIAKFTPEVTYMAVIPTLTELDPSLVIPVVEGMTAYESPLDIRKIRYYGIYYHFFEPILKTEEQDFQKAYNDYISNPKRSPVSVLTDLVKDYNLEASSIGIEKDHMPVGLKEALERALPEAEFKDVSETLLQTRMIKTAEEVERLKKSAEINDKALKCAIQEMAVGRSLKRIFEIWESEVVREGAHPLAMNLCPYPLGMNLSASRSSTSLFAKINDYKLEGDETVRIDASCRYKGYCSDHSRTIVLGSITEQEERILNGVINGTWETINMPLKPGLTFKEVHQKGLSVVRQWIPNYDRHAVGHGLGLGVHEFPDIGPTEGILQKDMVLNIETPYYRQGLGSFIIEDTVRITDNRFELLTQLDRHIRV